MTKRLLLCAYLVSSLWWGPAAEAAFHLERVDGSRPEKGVNLSSYVTGGRTFGQPVGTLKPPPAPRVVRATLRTSSGRCGGDLPPCWVMRRESGPNGDINAYNPTGCSGRGCYGKWQFDPRTGDGTGTEAEQDAEARRVWDNGRGCSHWAAC